MFKQPEGRVVTYLYRSIIELYFSQSLHNVIFVIECKLSNSRFVDLTKTARPRSNKFSARLEAENVVNAIFAILRQHKSFYNFDSRRHSTDHNSAVLTIKFVFGDERN